ncbi:ring-hydroxylating oxygenase subunit alpha [Pseudonocardia eucalypti]|uniref:Ring-hydroxylating oxygenase subunit alpha n=1 Tax=Pseudonocardia eucalypti TaxID=648755 RepID=A0ABP9Q7F1_9PSEU|nr:phenylpropionate dioxygenase-like ring-hydroxylating dioxygenase large terminal subunit [Pseudonocardia eucalypti]
MTAVTPARTLADEQAVAQRILDHIDHHTTDLSEHTWREPVANYRSTERFERELAEVFRRCPTPVCPSAAVSAPGDYLARDVAGTPILVARGRDGVVRAFRNACRHRGVPLADGAGCGRTAFVCRYHGWTYGLDGALRHVPDGYGFPDLDPAEHGLVPVRTEERHGLVFLTQDEPAHHNDALDELAGLIPPDAHLHGTTQIDIPANWKIVMDGFLEGYHLRATHRQTFYPIQFDNLNVIERFGRNSRVAFPYRRINKLREVAAEDRSLDGMLTFVYHLFPNVVVATFPLNLAVIVHEPLAVDRTRTITYTLTRVAGDDAEGQAALKQGLDFADEGVAEDREMVRAIQRGLASRANEHFVFGRFEGALTHYHRQLGSILG